jgi:cilia- and flagella-associated protein 57
LNKHKEAQCKEFEQMIAEQCTWQDQQVKKMKQEHELEKEMMDKEFKEMRERIDNMVEENKKQRKEIEDKAWDEINVIKEKNKAELTEIIDAGMDSKAKLTEVQGKFKTSNSSKEQLDRDISERQNRLNVLIGLKKDLAQQIESQESELKERDETIKDKQKKINDLRKKTQELEKFKFVLDYKIKELKRDIGPREIEIQKLNEQTNRMNQEVKHFQRVNNNLGLIVEDLTMRQDGLKEELGKIQANLAKQEYSMERFKKDVFECLQNIQDYKRLKKGCVALYKTYVLEERTGKGEQGESSSWQEYAQRRKYYESMVEYYRTQLITNSSEHKQQNNKYMKENVSLLIEINDLRKELHGIDINIRLLEQKKANEPNP